MYIIFECIFAKCYRTPNWILTRLYVRCSGKFSIRWVQATFYVLRKRRKKINLDRKNIMFREENADAKDPWRSLADAVWLHGYKDIDHRWIHSINLVTLAVGRWRQSDEFSIVYHWWIGMPLLAQFSLAHFSGARIWSAPLITANSQ